MHQGDGSGSSSLPLRSHFTEAQGVYLPTNSLIGDSSPVTILPEGTSLTFWTEHGNTISDALGNVIETGGQITVEQFPEAAMCQRKWWRSTHK